jgi:mutator protein MutT
VSLEGETSQLSTANSNPQSAKRVGGSLRNVNAHHVVVAAIIEQDGAFLVTRRLQGTHLAGLWEFPGGKIASGESHRQGLTREIREELDADVHVGGLVFETRHDYADRTVSLHFYRCTLLGTPRPVLGQQMQWVPRAELRSLDFPPADVELIRRLMNNVPETMAMNDVWEDGTAYESYMGRWSRQVAKEFVRWLALPSRSAWLDFGCGSGALAQTILAEAAPRLVVGCDQSAGYIGYASRRTTDPRAQFVVASVPQVPEIEGGFDACVAGLVLNFLPDPGKGLAALAVRVRPAGTIAAYVWDYGEGMELMRVFWDAAAVLDPSAKTLDEAVRFPLCRPEPLRGVFEGAGLHDIEVRAIDIPTVFVDFNDYWQPFLGGQGPAPGYLKSLPAERRGELRDAIQHRLSIDSTGRIALSARAWAIRGIAA